MKNNFIQKALRILLGSIMILAGIGHLSFQQEEYLALVPKWLSDSPAFLDFIVLSSGVVEIILGLGLIFLTKYQVKIGVVLAVFFVLVFPANVFQYTNNVNQGLNSYHANQGSSNFT